MLWDDFHYGPVGYEFANLLYLTQLCGTAFHVWQSGDELRWVLGRLEEILG